jgi:DNA-binding transcriptional ArsR family regulator
MTTSPQLTWDSGTAYDFFVSLHTLHHPKKFGLRGAWAVGVRSRLPPQEREFLQEIMEFMGWPVDWVYDLPQPKNAQTVLDVVADIPAAQRLPRLHCIDPDSSWGKLMLSIGQKGHWTAEDEETVHELNSEEHASYGQKYKRKDVSKMLDWWAKPDEFGELYLSSLQEYYTSFFAEDERRLRPALEQALEQAQALAEDLPLPELLEELSQGVKFDEPPKTEELVLAPSFWGSPFIMYGKHRPERQIILFGGRPANASIVPGDQIPDALFNSLKALADPTRLRILRYLIAEPLTPTELARRLRLRAPTVVHHLHTLRLARLVHLTFSAEGKKYQARREAVNEIYVLLNGFLDDEQS